MEERGEGEGRKREGMLLGRMEEGGGERIGRGKEKRRNVAGKKGGWRRREERKREGN